MESEQTSVYREWLIIEIKFHIELENNTNVQELGITWKYWLLSK